MKPPQICRLFEKFQFDCVRHKLFFGLYLHILHVKSVWYNVFEMFFFIDGSQVNLTPPHSIWHFSIISQRPYYPNARDTISNI